MKDAVVGIVGGYGRIGTETAKTLAQGAGCRILIGGRDAGRGQALAESLGGNTSAWAVDAMDPSSLFAFCERCDLVVNCAGPSRLIDGKVALAAIESGAHYVDVGGYDSMQSILESRDVDITTEKQQIIISSGMFPGLTEVFPRYIAGSYFDEVDTLAFYYAGCGDFSYSGAYDLICGMEEGASHPMTYYDNGLIKKDRAPAEKVRLPHPVGEVTAHLAMNNKARAMAETAHVKTARFYSSFMGESLGACLFELNKSAGGRADNERVEAAKALVAASRQDLLSRSPCHMMHLIMEGRQSGKNRKVESTLCFTDAHRVSGIVAAGAVHAVLGGTARNHGGFLLHQSVEAASFMGMCEAQGLMPHTTVSA